MFISNNKTIKRVLEYKKLLKKYEEDVQQGKGTYQRFSRLVQMNMNLRMPPQKGFHRDHIVPKSFCRKMGVSVSQTNHANNLRYILPDKNINKWSFLEEEELIHLKIMCELWGIEYPSQELIDAHNEDSLIKRKALHRVRK